MGARIQTGLCAFALACLAGACKPATAPAAGAASDRTFTVKRGDFSVVFRIDGQLDAIQNHKLQFKSKRGSRELNITYLLPEHTVVASNDVAFRISDEYFVRQETDLTRRILEAEQNYGLAERDLQMIHADNMNDLKADLDRLRTASDAYRKYMDEDAPKKKRELIQAVLTKQAAVRQANDDLLVARKNLTDAYSMEESAAKAAAAKADDCENKLAAAQQELDVAFYNLRIFKRYEHPQKLADLYDTAKRQTLTVQRSIVNNQTRLAKKRIELGNARARLNDLNFELGEIREDMAGLELRAPADGTLFYGDPEGGGRGWRAQNAEELKVGSDVYNGQILGFIPDRAKFLVKVNIPEEFRSRVKTGLPAKIRAKAIPNLVLTGDITSIAAAATPTIPWDQSSPKIYLTRISTDRADKRLIAGMTVQVDICIEEVRNVLFLPVEAVFNREGKPRVRLLKDSTVEERTVRTGRFSTDFIEIVDGLREGDTVLLAPGTTG